MAERERDHLDPTSADEFVRQAKGGSRGIVGEVLDFMRQTRKWWMGPILVALLIFGILVFLSSSVVAPYIYALF